MLAGLVARAGLIALAGFVSLTGLVTLSGLIALDGLETPFQFCWVHKRVRTYVIRSPNLLQLKDDIWLIWLIRLNGLFVLYGSFGLCVYVS